MAGELVTQEMINSKPIFPFSAVVGQSLLKTALLLNCIDNKIGGVLISGSRGSAKSTIARALSDFLPSGSHFVTLPLGASEEHVVGSLDINHALTNKTIQFKPGLLHKAHLGVLYIDEVNLLPDHLIDIMLDTAASGINHIERDGISQQHASEFILIGTMNPDEGMLRPQLLDRFGLSIVIEEQSDPLERIQIMDNRLAFESDPLRFCQQQQVKINDIKQRLIMAREQLAHVQVLDKIKLKVANACIEANVEGLRADIVWLRTAKAYAALNGSTSVTEDDVEFVRPMVLHHREQSKQAPKPPAQNQASRQHKPSHLNKSNKVQGSQSQLHEDSQAKSQGDWGEMSNETVLSEKVDTINPAEIKKLFYINSQIKTKNNHADSNALKQKKSKYGHGNNLQVGKIKPIKNNIDWFKTLSKQDNIHSNSTKKLSAIFKKSAKQQSRLHIILLDTSASTMAKNALAKAKAFVINISQQAYFAREQLAILTFGNQQCHWLIRPQRAPKDCHLVLDQSPTGGGTPLRQALVNAQQMIKKLSLSKPYLNIQTYLLSDGRSNDSFYDLHWNSPIAVIDMEVQAIPLGRAAQIAQQLNAQYQHISCFNQQQNR